jgi:hypothetical protein
MHLRAVVPAALALALAAGGASAAQHQWTWNRGDPGNYDLNDAAGKFTRVRATYDTVTKNFFWEVSFDDTMTQGITLAVNNGPNPKGHAGELGLLYVDVRDAANPKLLAYGYNGQNSSNSWQDGNGPQAGTQAADTILTSLVTPRDWLNSVQVVDVGGKRTIRFSIDATPINNRTPMYPDLVDPWTGVQFADKIGLWMHTYKGLNAAYDQAGWLTQWSRSAEGWFDGSNFGTTLIPLPHAGGLAGLGLLGLAAGRRRRI